MQETLLKINRDGLPAFSARGCHQSLKAYRSGDLKRTVNGELCYLGHMSHHKYISEIWCQDALPPACEGFWRGEQVAISCLQRVCQEIEGDGRQQTFTLGRPAVLGSLKAMTKGAEEVSFLEKTPQMLTFHTPPGKKEALFISYRPLLQMRITSFSLETDEWGTKGGWRLTLEEI